MHLTNGDTEMFTSLHDFLTFNDLSITTSVSSVITISSMPQFLSKYFPNLNKNNEYSWVKVPFSISLKYDHIPWAAKEKLIEIREDSILETEFHKKEPTELTNLTKVKTTVRVSINFHCDFINSFCIDISLQNFIFTTSNNKKQT